MQTPQQILADILARGALYREHFRAIHDAHGGDGAKIRAFLLGYLKVREGLADIARVGHHRVRGTTPQEAAETLARMIEREAKAAGW